MYNHSSIRDGLYGLVGFKDGLRTEFQIISTANKATSSGMYFQDYHSLVTVENLKNIAPESLTNDNINTWLTDLIKGSVVKVVNTVMQRFRLETKTVFENLRMYNYASVFDTTLTLDSASLVGYEIELSHVNNINLALNNIGLMFDGTVTDLTFYIFHSSQDAALTTFTASSLADSEKWTALTKTIDFVNSTYSGGKFYVCYKVSDLSTTKPVNREWDCANVQRYAHLFSVRPFQIDNYSGTTLFDLDDINYTADTYGLNFEFTAKNDVTKQILTQKSVFTNVVGYQFAVDFLERIVGSIRNNTIKTETRDLAFAELNAENGLRKKLEDEIGAVHIDLSGVDELTMPKRHRIKSYTTK